MRTARCNNVTDFRSKARRRIPAPIFHYIDGAADDEVTYRRNTEAYERCDLVPNVLAGVETIDMSTTIMGQRLAMPLFCSPTALQRLFHHDGERAVAKAAEKFGTMFARHREHRGDRRPRSGEAGSCSHLYRAARPPHVGTLSQAAPRLHPHAIRLAGDRPGGSC
jgi:hypothetical protein